MCSKCFREAQAAEQKQQHRSPAPEVLPVAQSSQSAAAAAVQPAPAVSEPSAVPEVAATSPSSGPAGAAAAATTAEAVAPAEPKVSTRCNKCRKKVGLTGFKCKCGLLFCGQHRYAEAHDCGFDYKTTQREKLAAANPLVQAAKVERI